MPQEMNARRRLRSSLLRITPASLWNKQIVLAVLALVVFVVYAPAVRLMLIHDDAANITWMNGFGLLSIFDLRHTGTTGASARPIVNALWILARELFGWYIPALIHYYNIFFHVLNAVLVATLAMRLSRMQKSGKLNFGLLAGFIFGLFPFSYQAVLWAGALYHPVLVFGGLLTIHTFLMARIRGGFWRWVLVLLSLSLAVLSHEAGFVFGLVIVLIDILGALSEQRRLHWQAFLAALLAILYTVMYRISAPGLWRVPEVSSLASLLDRVSTNAAYFMQALVSWQLIFLRPFIGLTESSALFIAGLFTLSLIVSGVWLWHKAKLTVGILALGVWAMTLAPALLLTQDYVRFSPRLLYASAIGISLYWALVATLVLQSCNRRFVRIAIASGCLVVFAWCVPYIADRMNETAKLTPAMRIIDSDARVSDPASRVLLINMPYWNGPTYPAFVLGVEGMPIFQSADTPAWTWLATVSGVRRDVSYVRHDISLTRGTHFAYGIPGNAVNDAVLRQEILSHNLIYKFDYDEPGLRIQRLARISRSSMTPVVTFSQASGRASIQKAQAVRCENGIQLNIIWGNVGGMSQPVAVFVHGYRADGKQVLVADRDLLDGYLPMEQVPFGLVIEERRLLKESVDAVHEVHIGLYNRVDGERFTVSDAGGSQLAGDEYVVSVTDPIGQCD